MNIFIFIVLQFLNVVLSTIRSVLTVRDNKWAAAISSAVYFGFYNIIIIFTVNSLIPYNEIADIGVKVLISFVANLVGTYIGKVILDKCRKDRLWEIVVTVDKADVDALCNQLSTDGIKTFSKVDLIDTDSNIVNIYTHNKAESRRVRMHLSKFNVTYIVHEENGRL